MYITKLDAKQTITNAPQKPYFVGTPVNKSAIFYSGAKKIWQT
jgi:hypothetical protein